MPQKINAEPLESSLYIQKIQLPSGFQDDSYLAHLPVVQALVRKKELTLRKSVTFFVGENGTGKSSLLENVAKAYGLNPEGGSKNYSFSTHEDRYPLANAMRLVKGYQRARDGYFLRAESFFNVASYVDQLDEIKPGTLLCTSYGGTSLHKQSHGESFLSLVLNRFWGHGLYILDEPESALSPSRQLTLLARIHQLAEDHSQFLIATHSPILMAYPGADLYLLDEEGFHLIGYRETEHYQLTRRFLENPEKMLQILLEE